MKALYEKHAALLLQTAYHHEGDREHPVFGEGPRCPRLMLLGEAPGREEALMGRPFVGRAGKELDALLLGAGIRRDEVFVSNAVKFRPTKAGKRGAVNRAPDPFECSQGLPLLQEEILYVQPKIIASLGNTPLRSLLALSDREADTVGNLHGTAHKIRIRGEAFLLFPLYHPASLIYNPALKAVQEEDIRKLRICLEELE